MNVGIMCSCMPSLPAFIKLYKWKNFRLPSSITRVFSRLNSRKGQKGSDTRPGQRIVSDTSPKLPSSESGHTRFGRMFKQEIGKMQSGWSALDTQVMSIQSMNTTLASRVEVEREDDFVSHEVFSRD